MLCAYRCDEILETLPAGQHHAGDIYQPRHPFGPALRKSGREHSAAGMSEQTDRPVESDDDAMKVRQPIFEGYVGRVGTVDAISGQIHGAR